LPGFERLAKSNFLCMIIRGRFLFAMANLALLPVEWVGILSAMASIFVRSVCLALD